MNHVKISRRPLQNEIRDYNNGRTAACHAKISNCMLGNLSGRFCEAHKFWTAKDYFHPNQTKIFLIPVLIVYCKIATLHFTIIFRC